MHNQCIRENTELPKATAKEPSYLGQQTLSASAEVDSRRTLSCRYDLSRQNSLVDNDKFIFKERNLPQLPSFFFFKSSHVNHVVRNVNHLNLIMIISAVVHPIHHLGSDYTVQYKGH